MIDPHQTDQPHDEHLEEEHDDAVIGQAVRYSAGAIVVLAAVIGGGVWFATRPEAEPISPDVIVKPPEIGDLPDVVLPSIPLVDITVQSGITFSHENGAAGEKLIPEMMGSGAAILDFDSDGDPDIIFINSNRWPWDVEKDETPRKPATMSAWRNEGDWLFVDVTEEVNLDISLYGQGAAVGDFDSDGDPDLYITVVGSNRLLENQGGNFFDVTDTAGVAGANDAWSSSAGFFDYDNDGDLDLFVCNYLEWNREFDVTQPFQLVGDERGYGRPQAFKGAFSCLYRNEGDGRFQDVSEAAGIRQLSASGEPLAKSLGVTFCDIDDDGWLDVLVSNDTVQNFLFRNKGDDTFEEIAQVVGVAFDENGRARGAMGLATAWFRNDRSLGIAIGNFSNEMTALYVAHPDTLQFRDEAVPTGLGPDTRLALTFGVCWADMDLDGRLDLLAANGHIETDINRVQPHQHYEQPPQLFWNCGPESLTEFVSLTAEQCGEDLFHPMVGRGVTAVDFDADGDLDVLITACGQSPRLLRNDQVTGNNWVRINVGRLADGTGAIVELHAGGQIQRRLVSRTRGYLTAGEETVSFGLGTVDQIDQVRVKPSGSDEWREFAELQVNEVHHLTTATGGIFNK
jgi:hypothetical protein